MSSVLRTASLLALATAALSASAATFTESVQFGPGPTDYSSASGTTAGPAGNQLYLFDANGGTLNSITFSYAYSLSSTITVTNTSATASTGNARTQSGAQFSSNDSAVTAALNSAVDNYVDFVDGNSVSFGSKVLTPIAADVRGTSSAYNLAPGGTTSFASTGGYSKPSFTVTDASVLSAFSRAGGGTFTPLFSTLTGISYSQSGGGVTISQVVTAQGNLVLSYNYTPQAVPEPSAFAALGLGAVALLRRRKRA